MSGADLDLGIFEQGETAHALEHLFKDAEGNADPAVALGNTPQVRMVNAADATDVVLNWATAEIPGEAGIVRYYPSAADMANPADYIVQFRYTRADGRIDYSPHLTMTIRANP